MSEQFGMIVKAFQGLEETPVKGPTALEVNDIQIGRRIVSFIGDKRMVCKVNFCLRTVICILEPIKDFTARDTDEVYNQVQIIPWEEYLDVNKTFVIDTVIFSEEFCHSKFVSCRVKDTIVDYFHEKTSRYPSVRINDPDVLPNIYITHATYTLSLDSSGESLRHRGYRQEQVDAPLNEILTVSVLLMTGWHGECDPIDPMRGPGTIPIETVLIAGDITPGVSCEGFAFEKWMDFDSGMFGEICNDDSQERELAHKIYGYDNNPKTNKITAHNIKVAGVSKDVTLRLQPFQQFEQLQEESIIVMNPPYSERVSASDLFRLYQIIGERLKYALVGNEVWVPSYRGEYFDQIGLKSSRKVPLFDSALEREFRRYEIFGGKYKEFKGQEREGEEKKETKGNYDTSRPREGREFKPRGEGEFKSRRKDKFKPRYEGEPRPHHEGEPRSRGEGEYRPRREGELKPHKEGDSEPRRGEGSFTRDGRGRKSRGELRGERNSRAPREFRGNHGPRIPGREEE